MPQLARSLDEALAPIADGCVLAIPRECTGVAMAATRALIRRGIKRLNLVALPTSSLQADILIGAGCVESIETSAVSLGEFGLAPRFTAAVMAGTIKIKDATCPALHAGFQAAEKGVPFMPLRGLIGSDVLAHRPDWKTIDNPFDNNDPIVLLPAIAPDVALFHAPMADRAGNVWIGRQRELVTMAHAAEKTVVTVEKIHDGNLLEDPRSPPARCLASMSKPSRSRSAAPGRCRCPTTTPGTRSISRVRTARSDRGRLRAISQAACL